MEFGPIPVARMIALDPWMEPLPSPGLHPLQADASLNASPRPVPKLLLLNSEGFTLWENHFEELKKLVHVWNSSHADGEQSSSGQNVRLISLVRAKHMSFSDAGILFPRGLNPFGHGSSESQIFLNSIHELASTFLESDGSFANILKDARVRDETVVPVDVAKKDQPTKWDKKFVGDAGDIIIHV